MQRKQAHNYLSTKSMMSTLKVMQYSSRRSREPQAIEPHICHWEDHRADPTGRDVKGTCEMQRSSEAASMASPIAGCA